MNENIKLYQGDCLEVMKSFPDESIDCVITSPPYWALRDYGIDGQLGLESTFQEYIDKLCNIFDEVKRILKKEGTCFVNIGDTYGGSGKGGGGCSEKTTLNGRNGKLKTLAKESWNFKKAPKVNGFPKSLIQIPSRFAIEMTNRGWILRNEIIWHKPNSLPQSAKDRFTVDFEKVFFFVKNKEYYFKQQLENLVIPGKKTGMNTKKTNLMNGKKINGYNKTDSIFITSENRNKRCVWSINTKPFKESHFATFPEALIKPMVNAGCPENGVVLDIFSGAGTTGIVAIKQDKKYIGIELNPEYIEMSKRRLDKIIEEKKQNLFF